MVEPAGGLSGRPIIGTSERSTVDRTLEQNVRADKTGTLRSRLGGSRWQRARTAPVTRAGLNRQPETLEVASLRVETEETTGGGFSRCGKRMGGRSDSGRSICGGVPY